ncbi:acyltransferase family protein [Fibrobacter sp. HC4]|uniref:acyltransferase family protein n=1 Tax=Fibrobacter sp. HC4 TaxID=3239812 RepID=UPI0034DB4FFC|nr:hypothetical protein [Fibrobacter succinogenes]
MRSISFKEMLIDASWSMWYLISLFSWRFIHQFIPSNFFRSSLILPSAFAFSLISGFFPINGFLSSQRTCVYLFFFLAGFVVKRNNIISTIQKKTIPPILILSASLIICIVFINFDINKIIWGFFNYNYSGFYWKDAVIYRFIFISTATLIGLSILCLSRSKSSFFSNYGQKTLFFYIYHTLILYGFFELIKRLNLPTSLPFLVLYTSSVIIILHITSHIRFLNFMINPVTGCLIKLNVLKSSQSMK